jgi:hypothetical protein
VQAARDGVQRINVDPLAESGLGADQAPQLADMSCCNVNDLHT